MEGRGQGRSRLHGRLGLGACVLALGIWGLWPEEETPAEGPVPEARPAAIPEPEPVALPVPDTSAEYRSLLARLDGEGEQLSRSETGTLFNLARLGQAPAGPNHFDESIAFREVAVRAAKRLQSADRTAYASWKLGLVYRDDQKLEPARKIMEAALLEAEVASPAIAPFLMLDLGAIARKEERYHDASLLTDGALAGVDLERFANRQHGALLADAYGNHYRIQEKLGNLDSATGWLVKQLEAAANSKESSVISNAVLNQVSLFMIRGTYDMARLEIERVLDPASGVKLTKRAKAELAYKLPRAAAAQYSDNYSQGGPFEEEAHRILMSEATPRTLRLPGLALLARLNLGWGQFEKAHQRLDQADAELAAMTGDFSEADLTAESAYLVIARSVVYAGQHRAALESGDLEFAAQCANALEQRRTLTEANFRGLLAAWAATPLTDQGVGFSFIGRRSRSLSGWIQLQRDFPSYGGQAGALDSLLAIQAMGSQARRENLSPGDLDEIRRELLAPGEGMAVFRLAIGGAFLFLIDEDELRSFALPNAKQLRRERDRLVLELLTPPERNPDGSVTERAQTLFQNLSSTFAKRLIPTEAQNVMAGWSSVTIVEGDSTVGWIPFEALEFEELGTLGLHKPMSYLNSVPTGLALVRRRIPREEPRPKRLLFVGAPTHSQAVQERWSGLTPLEISADMRADLLATSSRLEPEVVLYESASPDALSAKSLREASVLQLLCHGLYDRTRLHPAVLALSPSPGSPDGLLGYGDITLLESPPIVVLAACSAAKTPILPGEDAGHSLSSAWLQAGAQAVLLSPADLDYAATWALSLSFHAALNEGSNASGALLRARQELARRPEFNHPYYHSLLRLVGLGHRAGI